MLYNLVLFNIFIFVYVRRFKFPTYSYAHLDEFQPIVWTRI